MRRGERRARTLRAIRRKLHIVRRIWWSVGDGWNVADEPHRLAKKGLSCSCWMCSEKTREVGFPPSDQRKLLKGEGDWHDS